MFFSRRSVMRAALMVLLLLVPATSRADAPETTPFSEVFAQLAARLVGVVVNISTTQASATAPARPTAPFP